jgi:hypothetical protein
MEPINYMLDVQNPIEEAMRGYGLGRADIEQRQVMDMRAAAEARAASEFEMRRAEAERQRAAAEAGQAELMRLAELGANATTDDYTRAFIANPGIRQDLSSLRTMFEAPKLETMLRTSQDLYAAARMGNIDAVRNQLTVQLEAAQNSGDEGMAATYGSALEQLNTNPEMGLNAIAATSAFTMMELKGPEYVAGIDKALGVGGEATGTFRTLQERARAAGLTEGTPEYRDFMLRGGGEKGPLVQNIVGAGETEFAKKAGAEAATQFSTIANQGTAASRSLVELENLEANLANVETGGGAAFKAFLGGYGINTEDLGEIQAAQAAINRLVPQQRPPGSGTMSDADLALFKASLPALINQPGGNQIIIETIRAINEYDVAASIIAGQALDGEITQAEARKALRELPNPLADFRAPETAPKPGTQPVVIDGVTIQRIE